MKKLSPNTVFCILLYLAFLAVWAFIGMYALIGAAFGGGRLFNNLFGRWFLSLGILTGFIFVCSPLYLRKFIKKEWKIALVSIGMSVFYLLVCGGISFGARIYMSEFSTDKWMKYEDSRHYMIKDLEQKHGVVGMRDDEIVALLGEPTYKSENSYSYYIDVGFMDPWFYSIAFEDGIAVKAYKYQT